jgi:hypothetical protein
VNTLATELNILASLTLSYSTKISAVLYPERVSPPLLSEGNDAHPVRYDSLLHSVADPDPGSGAFLIPGSGIGDPRSGIGKKSGCDKKDN